MGRRNFSENQEVKFADLNSITYALERQFYDRILRQIVSVDQSGFWKSGFFVTRTDSDTISVASGVGYQIDNGQSSPQPVGRPIVSLAAQTLDIEAPDATNDRIDIVVTRSDLADEISENRRFKDESTDVITEVSTVVQRDWSNDTMIVTGTPAGSPSAPSVPSGYIKIAEVYVTAVTGIAATGAITDSRFILTIIGDGGSEDTVPGDFPLALDASKDQFTYYVDTQAAREITLPDPVEGFEVTFVDKNGTADDFPFTVKRKTAGTLIMGLDADYECAASFGKWTFTTDGTNWFLK